MKAPRAIFKPCSAPGKATVEAGIVLLDGPDGVAVAMTVECAEGTAASLREAVALARARAPASASAPAQRPDTDGARQSQP